MEPSSTEHSCWGSKMLDERRASIGQRDGAARDTP